jgi:hypothetical protein
MTNLSRRQVALFAPLGGIALLAGCTTASVTPGGPTHLTPLQQGLNDVTALQTGFTNALTGLTAVNLTLGLTPAQFTTITQDVQTAISGAKAVLMASGANASSLLPQLEAGVNQAVSFASSLPLPPSIAILFTAAAILLPFAESEINDLVGAVKPPAGGVQAGVLSPQQARAVLMAASS